MAMPEIEDIIARDLLANEYKGATNPDPTVVIFLAESAARRIVKVLADEGYVIRAAN
jgi:hypothetical protein